MIRTIRNSIAKTNGRATPRADRPRRFALAGLFAALSLIVSSRARADEGGTAAPPVSEIEDPRANPRPKIDKPQETLPPENMEPRPLKLGMLAGVGFPRPVAIEGFLQWDRRWVLGAEFSALPAGKIAGADTIFIAGAAEGRIHPFHGAFYVGMKAGYQHLSAGGYMTVNGSNALVSAQVDTVFVNPEIGFLFQWDSGLALGFGAGIQIPVYASSQSTNNLPVAAGTVDTIMKLGTGEVPTVDLFRIGLVL